jgi:hypothetical protein
MPESVRNPAFVLWPSILYLVVSVLFMLVATARYWPTPEIAFLSDNSPVSWLSSAQLWAIALLAVRLGADRALPLTAAIWLGAAMVVLGFDEQFMLHEHWKYGCINWWDACRHRWVTELPILLIGLLGAAAMVWLHQLLRARAARILLWSSLGVGILAIVVDLFAWPYSLVRLEEGLEVLAEALFTGALLGLRARSQAPDPAS